MYPLVVVLFLGYKVVLDSDGSGNRNLAKTGVLYLEGPKKNHEINEKSCCKSCMKPHWGIPHT